MNLALLGTDADALRLVAAAKREGHEFVWLGDVRPIDAAAAAALLPHLNDRAAEWELVLDRGLADAVIVGRGNAPQELRAEQLKRLAAEAMPLLVVQPTCESVLPYYEVDMTRREMGGIARHFNPLNGHPILPQIAGWVRESHPEIGKVHQLTCERHLHDGSRENVLAHLACDCELLAEVAGDIRKVSAIGPRGDDPSFASLQVQMTSTGTASLRWAVGSLAANEDRLDVRLIGERGTVTLRVTTTPQATRSSGQPDSWELETASAGRQNVETLETFDAARVAIRQLAKAIGDPQPGASASTWEAATRAMEVVDAVVLSLEKGRTIEVHQQHLTEQLAFRGTMAALGCGLLLVGFAVIVFITFLGGVEGKGRRLIFPSWPVALLALLAFFLLLQAVPFLAAKKRNDAQRANDRDSA